MADVKYVNTSSCGKAVVVKKLVLTFSGICLCAFLGAAGQPAVPPLQEKIVGSSFSAGLALKVAPVAGAAKAGMALHLASGWYDGMRLELFATAKGYVPALEIGRPDGAWMLKAQDPCVPPATWRHLAATWDGRVARLYVGSRLVAEGDYRGPWTPPKHAGTGALGIGRGAYGLSDFKMETRAAFLVNRVLPPDEIAARAGREDPPDAAALVELRRQILAYDRTTLYPPPDGFAAFRTNWSARTVDPYGPAPELPEGNRPLAPRGTRLFVSPGGDDAADGSARRPFRTLARARDAVRALKAKGLATGGVTVELADGVYPVRERLCFTKDDAGTPDSPILWCAAPGARPVLDGGFRVTGFGPVTDPAVRARLTPEAAKAVRVADVKAQGWRHFEPLVQYGFEVGEYSGEVPMTDVYQDDRRLELARYPDADWLTSAGGDTTSGVMRVTLSEWKRWEGEKELFYTGYPSALWADWSAPIKALDPLKGTITLPRRPNGSRIHRFAVGYPFFLSNALAALDRPGEWYLDRANGLLYVWPLPSADGREPTLTLPDFSDTFVAFDDVTDFEWRGISLRHGRGSAVVARRCARLTVSGCRITRFGNDGLRLAAATNVTVRGNTLAFFGHGGIRAQGGDRAILAPAGIVIEDNDISCVEQWKRTYAPGLLLQGCGAHVRRNRFHDMRSSAMRLEGNDFLVASNVVEDVVLESDDQGGIDIYANPAFAIRIVHNVWRNIGRGGRTMACGQAGVRFDDAVSNMIVYGNRFENCGFGHFGAVQINGGRNNTIDNNLFVNCPRAVSIGAWPQKRWEAYMRRAKAWPQLDDPLYRMRYPGLADLRDMPQTNRIWRNVVVGEGFLTGPAPAATDRRCNLAFGDEPTETELAENPLWDPLPILGKGLK